MTEAVDLPYTIKGRHMVARTEDLRVQILTLEPGEEIPWHRHSVVSDIFICLDGPMVVQTQNPDADHTFDSGQTLEVSVGTAHRVIGKDKGYCRFVIVQGIGQHDFLPVDGRDG